MFLPPQQPDQSLPSSSLLKPLTVPPNYSPAASAGVPGPPADTRFLKVLVGFQLSQYPEAPGEAPLTFASISLTLLGFALPQDRTKPLSHPATTYFTCVLPSLS